MLNVTSDNDVLGKTMTEVLFSAIGPDGRIVRLFHSAHPGVRQREIEALTANPGIADVASHYVQARSRAAGPPRLRAFRRACAGRSRSVSETMLSW